MAALNPSGVHEISLQAGWERSAEAGGGAVWTRRFGRPPPLPAGERVFLRVLAGAVPRRIELAGVELIPTSGSREWSVDVSDRLAARNVLRIVVAATAAGGTEDRGLPRRLPEEVARVWLEVRRASDSDPA